MADSTTAVESTTGATSSNHRLAKAKDSLPFLLDPKSGPQPTQLRTRAFLRSVRYIAIFVFWRLVRYAKYAAMGALVAAVSGTAIGSIMSGAAFVIAPTGIVGGAGMGLIYAVARFGFRRARGKGRKGGKKERSGDPRRDERDGAEGEREVVVPAPKVDPW
ncbi:hypothetical protein TI39_contig4130g00015 [Zymoseptoria brevis]|uniref:Transmembrane protein n=1 Tax=Zymoseptoria brevis TaxID=1047168 RepID=A0A0F4GCV4_9PEZI|nr:hypothetical protein TI39_contig4130g00015 [Zymoseptoria brevis]